MGVQFSFKKKVNKRSEKQESSTSSANKGTHVKVFRVKQLERKHGEDYFSREAATVHKVAVEQVRVLL
jgi:hypothetical protein